MMLSQVRVLILERPTSWFVWYEVIPWTRAPLVTILALVFLLSGEYPGRAEETGVEVDLRRQGRCSPYMAKRTSSAMGGCILRCVSRMLNGM